jgi:hypothetical protein
MPIVDLILRRYQETHKAALSLVEDLTEERFHWGPNRGLQSIAWQLWHIARWDDFLGEVLIGRTPALAARRRATQIWTLQNLAQRWRLGSTKLGVEEAGTDLRDEEAAAIRLPGKTDVSDYAAAAFTHVEEALRELDDVILATPVPGPCLFPDQGEPDTYGGNILIWIEHNREHQGVIQALRAIQGPSGGQG